MFFSLNIEESYHPNVKVEKENSSPSVAMTDPKMLQGNCPNIKMEKENILTASFEMDHTNSTEEDQQQQEMQIPALNGDQESTTILNPPDLTGMIPAQQVVEVAKLSYKGFTTKIFTIGTSKQFFFEPTVMLDPQSVTIQPQDLFKEDVVSFTIQMWNSELRSKVLELLRLDNAEINEKDVSVMPYKEVQLVGKLEASTIQSN